MSTFEMGPERGPEFWSLERRDALSDLAGEFTNVDEQDFMRPKRDLVDIVIEEAIFAYNAAQRERLLAEEVEQAARDAVEEAEILTEQVAELPALKERLRYADEFTVFKLRKIKLETGRVTPQEYHDVNFDDIFDPERGQEAMAALDEVQDLLEPKKTPWQWVGDDDTEEGDGE